jgi:hypothetical protein
MSADTTKVIRVHTQGRVYARIMKPMPPIGLGLHEPLYQFIEMIEVPEGLTQQGVVNHFRALGWTVEQDHGTDDDPQWGE